MILMRIEKHKLCTQATLLDNKGALINNEHAYIFPKQGITYGVITLKKGCYCGYR